MAPARHPMPCSAVTTDHGHHTNQQIINIQSRAIKPHFLKSTQILTRAIFQQHLLNALRCGCQWPPFPCAQPDDEVAHLVHHKQRRHPVQVAALLPQALAVHLHTVQKTVVAGHGLRVASQGMGGMPVQALYSTPPSLLNS